MFNWHSSYFSIALPFVFKNFVWNSRELVPHGVVGPSPLAIHQNSMGELQEPAHGNVPFRIFHAFLPRHQPTWPLALLPPQARHLTGKDCCMVRASLLAFVLDGCEIKDCTECAILVCRCDMYSFRPGAYNPQSYSVHHFWWKRCLPVFSLYRQKQMLSCYKVTDLFIFIDRTWMWRP
jgi:hypothetical protein